MKSAGKPACDISGIAQKTVTDLIRCRILRSERAALSLALAAGIAGTAFAGGVDKYTQYVADYTGKNLASFGYSSLGGDRRDYLGDASVLFEFVTTDGRYVNPMDEEAMKQYRVTSQSVAPDTEVKLEFQKDEDGNEYSSLIAWQAVDEIDLALSEVGSNEDVADLPKINVSPDKYTWDIRSYVGKNAANIGYVSWGGDRRDAYGAGNVQLVFNADDGSYLDATDNKQMCQYVVTAQDVEPNTELSVNIRSKNMIGKLLREGSKTWHGLWPG